MAKPEVKEKKINSSKEKRIESLTQYRVRVFDKLSWVAVFARKEMELVIPWLGCLGCSYQLMVTRNNE